MSDRDPNQDFSHAIRPCRGHWHVVVLDADGTSTDLAIEGDPFTSEESAQRAAERLNRGENIPGLLPAWPAASAVVETPRDEQADARSRLCDAIRPDAPHVECVLQKDHRGEHIGHGYSWIGHRPAVVETPAEAPTPHTVPVAIRQAEAVLDRYRCGATVTDSLAALTIKALVRYCETQAAVAGPRVPEGGGTDAAHPEIGGPYPEPVSPDLLPRWAHIGDDELARDIADTDRDAEKFERYRLERAAGDARQLAAFLRRLQRARASAAKGAFR